VTILFGPVVFQVAGTTLARLLEGLELPAMNTHRIWPYQGPFTWTPRPGFDEQQVVGLADLMLNECRRRLTKAG
jgi:hypothetical protein